MSVLATIRCWIDLKLKSLVNIMQIWKFFKIVQKLIKTANIALFLGKTTPLPTEETFQPLISSQPIPKHPHLQYLNGF